MGAIMCLYPLKFIRERLLSTVLSTATGSLVRCKTSSKNPNGHLVEQRNISYEFPYCEDHGN